MPLKTSADRHIRSACGLSWPDESQLRSSSCIHDIGALLCLNQYIRLKGRACLLGCNTATQPLNHKWLASSQLRAQPEEPRSAYTYPCKPCCQLVPSSLLALRSLGAKVFGAAALMHCSCGCLTAD